MRTDQILRAPHRPGSCPRSVSLPCRSGAPGSLIRKTRQCHMQTAGAAGRTSPMNSERRKDGADKMVAQFFDQLVGRMR
jgi:hypothetical protein